MREAGKGKRSALIAAGCFTAVFLYIFITQVGSFYRGSFMQAVSCVLLWVGLIGLGISAFLGNKKYFSAAAVVVCLAYILMTYRRVKRRRTNGLRTDCSFRCIGEGIMI